MNQPSPAVAKTWARLGPRAIYGLAMLELAESDPDVLALSADLANSSGLERFRSKYPDRFLNTGIAEQNMIGIAGGLASEGFTVFASSFVPFLMLRAGEQMRMNLGYMALNVKAVGLGGGLSMGTLGCSHYGIEDVALARAIPGLTVVNPSDVVEVQQAVHACAAWDGPVYLRLTGVPGDPLVDVPSGEFEIGKIRHLKTGSDVAILAVGSMVSRSMRAAELLEERGISCSVSNVHTLNPLGVDDVLGVTRGKRLVATVEEHSIVGGLGSAVAEIMSEHAPASLVRLGIPAVFPKAARYETIVASLGLDPVSIASRIESKLNGGPK